MAGAYYKASALPHTGASSLCPTSNCTDLLATLSRPMPLPQSTCTKTKMENAILLVQWFSIPAHGAQQLLILTPFDAPLHRHRHCHRAVWGASRSPVHAPFAIQQACTCSQKMDNILPLNVP
ncbi:hypothetical protein TRVL_10115 [Trypanosoma vivax]|nr:hypothetical protein TRVL_10115 [Trypanosoma vivax]